MSSVKKRVADLFFGVQIVGGTIFCAGQGYRMLTTTQGINASWFVMWEVFLVLNLVMAIRAHQNQPSRVTVQTVFTYSWWLVLVSGNIVAIFWQHRGAWDHMDTVTALLVGVGGIVTVAAAQRKGLGLSDPVVRGYLGFFFKSVPQLTLAYKIYEQGGAGLATLTVVTGHLTVLTRIGQLGFSIREAGWDRNRIGAAIGEVGNEGGWIIVTLIWLLC